MFKFIRNDMDGKVKREFDYTDPTWFELVEEFQTFLEGCGYVFIEGFTMRDILQAAHEKELSKQLKKEVAKDKAWK